MKQISINRKPYLKLKVEPTQKQAENFLTLLFAAQVAYDLCEELKDSPYNVQDIKLHMNGIKQAVDKRNGLTNDLFTISHFEGQAIYENCSNLLSSAFKLSPENWSYIEGLTNILIANNETTTRLKAQIANYFQS